MKKLLFMLLTLILITIPYCNVKAADESNVYDSSDVTAVLSRDTYKTVGYVRTPSVKVTDAYGNVLAKGTDYTVSYD